MDEFENEQLKSTNSTKPFVRIVCLISVVLVFLAFVFYQVMLGVPTAIDPTFAQSAIIMPLNAQNNVESQGVPEEVSDEDLATLKSMFSRQAYRKTSDIECDFAQIVFEGNGETMTIYLSEPSVEMGMIMINNKDFYTKFNAEEQAKLYPILEKYGVTLPLE